MEDRRRGDGWRRGRPALRSALLAALLTLPFAASATAAPSVEWERWYVVLLEGRPSGWMHTVVGREGGLVVTEDSTRVTLGRGGVPVTVEVATRFTETETGEPVEAQTTQRLAAEETVEILRFDREGVEITHRESGRERTRRAARPEGTWLTPAAVRRLVAAENAKGSREIRYRSLESGNGLVVSESTMKLVGRESAEAFGVLVPALAWEVSSSALPGVVERQSTDEFGRVVRSTLPLLPGLTFTVVQADRDLALARVDPPEILARTLVTPTGTPAAPRELRRAVYRLAPLPAAEGLERMPLAGIPDTGSQGATRLEDGSVQVVVDLDAPRLAEEVPPGNDCRRANSLIDADAPEVTRLAQRALAGAASRTPSESAEALRRFVHHFVTRKDLSVGFASAGQVARTAQGDCTEHAVLLAALLRNRGIPSRVASGLVFVDRFLGREGVFGYHMWTQAWLEHAGKARWIDLDATLDDRPFDAAHIALGTSALADGDTVNDLLKLVPLIGRLSIEVVEAR